MDDKTDETRKRVKRLILGQKKICAIHLRDDRVTRFGFRNNDRKVLDEFPGDVPCPRLDASDLDAERRNHSRTRVMHGYIREYANGEAERVAIVQRRFLFGQPITMIASEEDVKYSSARSIVNRFERFLGIPPKQRRR